MLHPPHPSATEPELPSTPVAFSPSIPPASGTVSNVPKSERPQRLRRPNSKYSEVEWELGMIGVSLEPRGLQVFKGEGEIGDTYLTICFRRPVISFDGLVSQGGGEEKFSDQ